MNLRLFAPLALVLLQGPTVQQIGPTADKLTADDTRQIQSLISSVGATWLLVAERPEKGRPDEWPVNVYFAPNDTTAPVRRGRLGFLKAQLVAPGDYSGTRRWELLPFAAQWAQISTEPGRPLRVENNADRPFAVIAFGSGQDVAAGELHDIVRLVRSSPRVPAAAAEKWTRGDETVAPQVNGDWAIDRVVITQPGSAEVALVDVAAPDRSGQYVKVKRVTGDWVVQELSWWGL